MSITQSVTKSRRGRPRSLVTDAGTSPNIDLAFMTAMKAFLEVLSRDQGKTFLVGKSSNTTVSYHQIQGRRFDRVVRTIGPKSGPGRRSTDVIFFVDHETGDIYAPKSPKAPNANRWYGKLANIEKWDWSGEFPRNVSDDTAKAKEREYGEVIFYEPA